MGLFPTSIHVYAKQSFSIICLTVLFQVHTQSKRNCCLDQDILFKITPDSICQMLKIQYLASMKPFSVDSLMKLYKNPNVSPQNQSFQDISMWECPIAKTKHSLSILNVSWNDKTHQFYSFLFIGLLNWSMGWWSHYRFFVSVLNKRKHFSHFSLQWILSRCHPWIIPQVFYKRSLQACLSFSLLVLIPSSR